MNTLPPKTGNPTTDLAPLEEKRRAMRRKALEYLTEADRLDALYAAVTGAPQDSPQPDSDPNPDGGPI
jgi:hypothetical protein